MGRIDIKRICVICEGFEEEDYLNTLINKNIFSDIYKFTIINAKSIDNIYSRYSSKYSSNSYDIVLIFCDTDKEPCEKYNKLKSKINEMHGNNVSGDLIIFGNPCTMQIIISHFAKVKLASQSKRINATYIKEHCDVQGYNASEEKRNELFSKIKRSNYQTMKENVGQLHCTDNLVSSTNILKFLENFENNNTGWIDEINKNL